MSAYTLVVFLHIAAAVLLLATSIVGEPLVRAAVRRATGVHELRAYLRIGRPMARLSPLAAILVLITGLYLTSQGRFWALGWVQAAIGFWVVNSVLAAVVIRRAVDAVAAAAGPSVAAGADAAGARIAPPGVPGPGVAVETTGAVVGARLDAARWASPWSWGLDALAANDAVTLAIMTLKPSLGGSLLLFLLANAGVAGGRMAFGDRRPPVARAVVVQGGAEG